MKEREAPSATGGNLYDKYNTRNPVARYLLRRFLHDVDRLIVPLSEDVRTITEIGCGEGYLTAHIASLGIARVVRGCDSSPEIIEYAASLHGGRSTSFYVKSVYEADETDGADLVVCCEVLEHLRDPAAGMKRLASITDKYCLLSVPDEPLWRMLNMLRCKYMRSLGNTPGHVNHWRKKDFVNMVARYFEVLEVRRPLPWVMVLARKRKSQVENT